MYVLIRSQYSILRNKSQYIRLCATEKLVGEFPLANFHNILSLILRMVFFSFGFCFCNLNSSALNGGAQLKRRMQKKNFHYLFISA